MTKDEFSKAVEIAKSDADLSADVTGLFDGCGLPGFEPVHVTLRNVAELIRWQALQLNGQFDAEALNEVANIGRKRFIIVG
jgi:hypothetical protein